MAKSKRGRFSRRQLIIFLLLVVAALFLASGTLVHLLTESWWFTSVGFADVFWTLLLWRGLSWLGTLIIFALFLGANYMFAMRVTRYSTIRLLEGSPLENYSRRLPNYVAPVVIFFIALTAAGSSEGAWEPILEYFNATEFAQTDPIFQRDLSFFVFQLPLYEGLQDWLLALFVCAFAIAASVYLLKGTINPHRGWQQAIYGEAKAHLSLLLAAIAFTIAIGFWLERYDLLFNDGGVVAGAGYTDTHSRLIALTVMSLAAIALAVSCIALARRDTLSWLGVAIAIYFALYIAVGLVYPYFEQRFLVEPNELAREKPYLEYNIALTRQAYNLDEIETQPFPAEAELTRQDLAQNQATIRNIRLWDYRPLLRTYRQVQGIRPYYTFTDVDVDRYSLDGNYRQVTISPRELSQSPRDSWVSERLKYTHGFGLVMSPVNIVTADGLPELFIRDIPPVSEVDLAVEEAAIYYGEATQNYIFTGMGTPEFDYPLGDENAQTFYDGAGGVDIPSFWQRLAYAYDIGDLKILISSYFQRESRIHYHRQIEERITRVAPFLRLDSDPYIALIDGRLKWIVEGYTVSDRFPYSEQAAGINRAASILGGQPYQLLRGEFNYARNSVKIVVDAYDGTMVFYAIDPDPLLQTYSKIFPNLFTSNQEVPASLRDHFRYPLDLYKIQAQMYLRYHMGDAEVFYNNEDLWRFPTETYEDNAQLMEPYYIIMRLPELESEEFVLILPFTPNNKDNTIAWMAARSDGENYGKLLLYEFPKQKLVFGPQQIEARIDQNPEISQQLSLWNQRGSRVIRGNLLVIPIEKSLLYVEPIYLRAEQSELPELSRVVVAYNERVVMRPTLEESLAAIFGEEEPATTPETTTAIPDNLTRTALDKFEQAQAAAQRGDWAEYGRLIDELEQILQQLDAEAGLE